MVTAVFGREIRTPGSGRCLGGENLFREREMRDGQAAKTAAGVAKLLQKPVNGLKSLRKMERAKGFEPSTLTLAT